MKEAAKKKKSYNLTVWNLIEAISRVGSLTDAAAELNLDISVASKLIASLEEDMGVRFLDRSTRPAKLSNFASQNLKLISDLLSIPEKIELAAKAYKTQSSKRKIKFRLATCCIAKHTMDFLSEFEQLHQDVSVEIFSENSIEALKTGRIDVAYFYNKVEEPGLLQFPCGTCANFLVASPSYLETHGTPTQVEDLVSHTLLIENRIDIPETTELFNGDESFNLNTLVHTLVSAFGKRIEKPVSPSSRGKVIQKIRNSDYTNYLWALKGAGIAVDLPLSFIRSALADKRLVPVLPGWHRKTWKKHLAINLTRADSPLLAGFIDFFQAKEKKDAQQRWRNVYLQFGIPLTSVDPNL